MYDEILEDLILYFGKDYTSKQEDFVLSLIDEAVDEIVSVMYPYELSDEDLDKAKQSAIKRHKSKIKRIVQYHYDKQGKAGVLSYSENNTTAMYENSGTPASYLRGIIPVSRVI